MKRVKYNSERKYRDIIFEEDSKNLVSGLKTIKKERFNKFKKIFKSFFKN